MRAPTPSKVQSCDTNAVPWEVRHIDELDADIAVKPLISDPETGMSAMKLKPRWTSSSPRWGSPGR